MVLQSAGVREREKQTDSTHSLVLQVLDVGDVVPVPHAACEDTEPFPSKCVDHRAAVRQKVHITNVQHAAEIRKPKHTHT